MPPKLQIVGALIGLTASGLITLNTAAPAQAASARPSESAGSARIGTAAYALPSGAAVYVAKSGSDANAGTLSAPVATLTKALTLAGDGSTIVMRAGSYNESVAVYKDVTIQNYPNEEVWLDGTTPVTGWVQDGSTWRRDAWTVRFDHSPTYTKGAADSTNPGWQFVDTVNAPMAAHPDAVWINGTPMWQVKSKSLVTAGKFYLDESTSKLYVGTDPSGKSVVASNLPQAMNIRAAGVTVRGIGFRRYAPSVWHVGAITSEKPNVTLENVNIQEMATTGLSLQSSNTTLRNVTVGNSGMLGINGRFADGLVMDRVLTDLNNTQRFNVAPVSGGVKLGATRGVTVTDSSFSNNPGHGFWLDLSVYNTVITGSKVVNNAATGLFFEISAKVVVGDTLISGNGAEGILVNNTTDVKLWNNTIVGNARPLNLVQDARRNTNKSDQAVDPRQTFPDPTMPWTLGPVVVSNNVIGPAASGNCLLCVEDYSSSKYSAETMGIKANGNVYNRTSASSPNWLVVWSKASANPSVFTTLSAFKSSSGQEARGIEFTGSRVVELSGAVSSTVQDATSKVAVALPSDVAKAIGRPAGSLQLGIWDSAGTSAAGEPTTSPAPTVSATPTPTVTPTPTATATPTAAPTSSPAPAVVAHDNYGRTVAAGGWGSAISGGAWTVDAPSKFKVSSGLGRLSLTKGKGSTARLTSAEASGTELQASFTMNKAVTGTGHYASFLGRTVAGVGDYRAKVRVNSKGKVLAQVVSTVNGKSTVLASKTISGLTWKTAKPLLVKLQVTGTGTTSLKLKVWQVGLSEPSAWQVTATNATSSLQKPGGVGLAASANSKTSNGTVEFRFDDLLVTRIG